MQTVTDRWKNAHTRTILNESYVEVTLSIADPDALAVATPQDNGAIYISDTPKLTNGVDKKPTPYCTLEQNLWVLNGERMAIQEAETNDNGFVGDALSNEVCVFDAKIPTITIGFKGQLFTKIIPGITITWSETYSEYADNFIVIAYRGNNIVAQQEVIGNKSIKSLVVMDIAEYDKIVIQVKKWCLPNRRARVEEIFVGLDKAYSKADLFDYSHKQVVDPISASLPKSEIKFSIDNANGDYNPHNAQGLSKYLIERQEIKSRYGLKLDDGSVEWIKGGTFYLSEWYAKQNGITADFSARDLLEFLSDTYFDTGNYLTSRSLFELAEVILSTSNLPLNSDGTVKWVIDESLKDIKINVNLPKDTRANLLQLIANAGMCALYQDRDGILRIEPLKDEDTDYKINSFNSYSKSEVTLGKPIGGIIVKAYNYGHDTSIDVYHPLSSVGEAITIDNPLITYYIDDMGLDTTYAQRVAEWIATNLQHRMSLDSSWRADVRLDALDIVKNENEYNTSRVRMTEVEFKYNGAFRGTGKGKVISDG